MPGMHELRLPERVFQDPGEDDDLMEAQFIWSEEEEEEEEQIEEEEQMEEEEQVEEVEQGEEGDAASSSSLPVWGTLEEVAAAAIASFPQSPWCLPLSHCHGCQSWEPI